MIITWTVCEIDTIQGQKVLQRREMHMGKRCRGERCKGEPDKEKCMGGGGGGHWMFRPNYCFPWFHCFPKTIILHLTIPQMQKQ
jgi:hypothetical protein